MGAHASSTVVAIHTLHMVASLLNNKGISVEQQACLSRKHGTAFYCILLIQHVPYSKGRFCRAESATLYGLLDTQIPTDIYSWLNLAVQQ